MPDSSAKPPNKSGFFSGTFMLIWLLGWTVATLVGDAIWTMTMVWQAETSSYVSTAGTIVESKVETGSGSEGETTYSAKVDFEYQVGGQKYRGNRISYATRFTSGRKAARNTVRRYPRGKQVTVYYSPAKPAAAVLEPGIRGSDFFLPLCLTPFNLITIGGWYAVIASRRKGRPLGLSVRDNGLNVVAMLYNVRPITAAGVALLIASFVLIFVCGFEIIPAPTDWVVVGAWCTALGAAAWAYAVFRQPRTRLEYDQLSGRITIVQSDGQEHAFTSSAVARVGVDEVGGKAAGLPEQQDSDGQRLTNVSPTITYRDAQDVEQTVSLANWSSREAAEWTAAWLRQTLRLKG
jgi:hypothetical protein